MSQAECFREPDVVDAVRAGEWPDRAEPALRDHVASCPVCSEVAAVALAFQIDADDTRHVHIPTAAHVWWRAGIRARQDAAQKASRPMTIVEGFAVASAAGLAAGAITLGWSGISSGWQGTPTLPTMALAVAGITAAVIFVPVALYFTLSEPKA